MNQFLKFKLEYEPMRITEWDRPNTKIPNSKYGPTTWNQWLEREKNRIDKEGNGVILFRTCHIKDSYIKYTEIALFNLKATKFKSEKQMLEEFKNVNCTYKNES